MRFYRQTHQFYCGLDLHARSIYGCVLNARGEVVAHRNLKAEPEALLRFLEPFRPDVVVGVECIFTWYWLADLCGREGIPFTLGHALYMKAVHGGKAKNDRIDSLKIATLLRGGMFPMAYVYPASMRSTRDLLRRRLFFVRQRGQLLAHIQNTHSQYNLPAPANRIVYKCNRAGLADAFSDRSAAKSVAADLMLARDYDTVIRDLELYLARNARADDPDTFHRLQTIPGVGKILALTLLYEIHDIDRFPTVQQFVSYARLVRCARESAGKPTGGGGKKIGNPHLKWAFSEAAVLFLQKRDEGKNLLERLQRRHGKGKALSILARKLGRATWFLLKRRRAFDMKTFLSH